MTGLEILDRVAFGQTLFHRDRDAWDLLDRDGLVVAVLCPRQAHLSISPLKTHVPPAPASKRMPYGERVEWKIAAESLDKGATIIRQLVTGEQPA